MHMQKSMTCAIKFAPLRLKESKAKRCYRDLECQVCREIHKVGFGKGFNTVSSGSNFRYFITRHNIHKMITTFFRSKVNDQIQDMTLTTAKYIGTQVPKLGIFFETTIMHKVTKKKAIIPI